MCQPIMCERLWGNDKVERKIVASTARLIKADHLCQSRAEQILMNLMNLMKRALEACSESLVYFVRMSG
jgi:hypothetical protein